MRRVCLAAAGFALVAGGTGCSRKTETVATAPAASSTSSAASAATAVASQPSGPIIAPQAALPQPTEEARQLGSTLANQGATNVGACASCHGPNGEGNANTGFPRLAGQSYVYLLHELDSYFDESRTQPAMSALAKVMSRAQREAGAAYYASLGNAPATASTPAPAAAGSRGRQLASSGDEARAVQACANCHGPDGIGVGASYPYLAGQHAAYLAATLAAWRDGTRHNDPSGQMPIIAKALAEGDLQAVASYYGQLPPPPRRDDDVVERSAAAAANAVVSGPRGGPDTQAPQGVGTAQGALTGGAQGPGGGGAGTGGPGGSATGESAVPTAPPAASR